jgi:murein DD-endopeptidase MepM/ murein hydrolase activator NlpD
MGRDRGIGLDGRRRAAGLAVVAALCACATPAAAQSTGGVEHQATPPAPRLSAPPPGVTIRKPSVVTSWRCRTGCVGARVARTGSVLRLRGVRLGRTYEVTFLGAEGVDDDVSTAPLRRDRKRLDVRVPLTAAGGPVLVSDRDGQQSAPTAAPLQIEPSVSSMAMAAAPAVEVQVTARRAFFDAARPAKVVYMVHGDAPAQVTIELVRARDGAVVASWSAVDVPPDVPQALTWDGTVNGKIQRSGRYSFRVAAVVAGAQAVTARSSQSAPDPAAFDFLGHVFPVRGPHGYGEFAASFGGGRGHQGQDVFAACGTPLVAARGGVVAFKEYHSRAGHYLVIDGVRTGIDYAYMHLRDAPMVNVGDRVHTGQLIGYVGQTGRASGCHLHLEMWNAPGWYKGGRPFDPLPSLTAWDKTS